MGGGEGVALITGGGGEGEGSNRLVFSVLGSVWPCAEEVEFGDTIGVACGLVGG